MIDKNKLRYVNSVEDPQIFESVVAKKQIILLK